MTETKFTPGPWKLGHDMFGAVHVYTEDGDRITNDRMTGGSFWRANAALIAAAPELFSVLQTIVNEYDDAALLPDDIDDARVALAKARGEDK